MSNSSHNIYRSLHKPNFCSPSNEKLKYSCFTKNALINIAKTYNNSNSSSTKIKLNSNKQVLHKNISERLYNICDNEHCWISNKNPELEKKTFRPNKPCSWYDNSNTWLNSNDISNVMSQYETAFNNFKFVGVFPIDFFKQTSLNQCISQEMCNLNIETMYNSKRNKIGVIYNLDKHDESGSHWVSMYICLDPNNVNYGIYYYDSAISGIPKEIKTFMNYVSNIMKNITLKKNIKRKFLVKANKKQHQFKNTECGMFSMYFILQCLEDKNVINDIYNSNITDDHVFKFRDIYFKPNLNCSNIP